MTDAASPAAILDVFTGHTVGSLLDDILDQDGAQNTASTVDTERVLRWIHQGIARIRPLLGDDEAGQRFSTLSVVSGTSRYKLDYDVGLPTAVFDAEGRPVTCMRYLEAKERLEAGSGTWPDGITLVLEERDKTGRWIVRVQPVPEAAATYSIVHTPNVENLRDYASVVPLPTVFHDALEEFVLAKLFRRQEDSKMLEGAMVRYQMALNEARSGFRPLSNVSRGFRSTYDNRPSWRRTQGRMHP